MAKAERAGGAELRPTATPVLERSVPPGPAFRAVEPPPRPGRETGRPALADLDPDAILDQVSAARRRRRVNTASALAAVATVAVPVLGFELVDGVPVEGLATFADSGFVASLGLGAVLASVTDVALLRPRRRQAH